MRSEVSDYRPDVDGLRAVAVLAVVVFHFFPTKLRGGFVGVDIFFVISGYLISGLVMAAVDERRFSFIEFYGRRVRRLFPALLIVLAACLAIGMWRLTADEFAQLGKHVAAGSVFASNFLLWSEVGYFDTAAGLKPLLHLWSLAIEEQFYLLWPVGLWLLVRRCGDRRMRMAIMLALASLSFGLSVWLVARNQAAAFYLPLSRFWELLAGSLLACRALPPSRAEAAQSDRSLRSLRSLASAAGLMLVIVSMLVINESRTFPGAWALLPGIGAAMVIAAGPGAWANRRVLGHPLMVGIGKLSYPLYLWHWPMLVFLRLADYDQPPDVFRIARLVVLGLAGLLACLTWRYVEVPARRMPARAAAGWLALGMVGIGSLGLWILDSGGFPGRFSRDENLIASAGERYRQRITELYRSHTCFLQPGEDARKFGPACYGSKAGGSRGGVLLWGDSHAAHLYPGIRPHVSTSGIPFSQLTAGDCPPLPEHASIAQPACPAIYRFVLDWLREHRPQTVLLAADWTEYPDRGRLAEVVAWLHDQGIQRVVIVGPVAMYPKPLPRLLRRASRRGALPERLPTARMPELAAIDRTMHDLAEATGAQYVSPLGTMCDTTGCLAALQGRPGGLVTWDADHLTDVGSTLVVDRLLAGYLQPSSP